MCVCMCVCVCARTLTRFNQVIAQNAEEKI